MPDALQNETRPLAYTIEELRGVMLKYCDKIIEFVTSERFRAIMDEMSNLSHLERPLFVHDILLNNSELRKRGVIVPEGILIQRSAFGDRRPTLFAVKHFLPEQYRDVWENVNITFDNEYLSEVPRDREICWRAPLQPDEQAQAMVEGKPLEIV